MVKLPGQGDNVWWRAFAPVFAPQAAPTFRSYVSALADADSGVALPRLARALEAARVGTDSAAAATVWFYTGAHHLAQANASEAAAAFAASVELWPETDGDQTTLDINHAATREGLARSLVAQGAYEEALDARIAIRDLLVAADIPALTAEAVRGMADTYFFGLNYNIAAAAPLYQEARDIYKTAEDTGRSLALTSRRLALLLLIDQQAAKATPLLSESIGWYHAHADTEGEAGGLALLALARLGLDGVAGARQTATGALNLVRNAGVSGTKAEGWALLVRGRCALVERRRDAARTDIAQADAIFTARRDVIGLAQIHALRQEGMI